MTSRDMRSSIYFFSPLPAGLLGPSTALSTCPAIPSLLASNCDPITPSLLSGPPIAWPICPMAPSGLNCFPIAPAEEMIEGFCGIFKSACNNTE
jgi:hypothetical protein